MVILTLSPRGYVTEGFDILYNPITDYIYNILCKTGENWWENHFVKNLKSVFKDKKVHLKSGSLEEIRKHYDELYLFRLFSCTSVNQVFSLRNPNIIEIAEKLCVIRNEWAHRDFPYDYAWAERSLIQMINLSRAINNDDTIKKLSVLRDKLLINVANPEREFISDASEIKSFLEKRVLARNESLLEDKPECLSEEDIHFAFSKIESSRNQLSKISSPEGVVAFYWNAIIHKSYSYNVTKKFGITFEDVRDEFDEICYGKPI